MRGYVKVAVVFAAIVLFSSGACDPPMRETPYTIRNASPSDIAFGVYYVHDTPDAKEYLLKCLREDLTSFDATAPNADTICPGETRAIKSFSSRNDLLNDSDRSIIFVWIEKTKNMETIKRASVITFDDLDYCFLGKASDLARINWEIAYR